MAFRDYLNALSTSVRRPRPVTIPLWLARLGAPYAALAFGSAALPVPNARVRESNSSGSRDSGTTARQSPPTSLAVSRVARVTAKPQQMPVTPGPSSLVNSRRAVLFDFDGPLCDLFSELTSAEAAAIVRTGLEVVPASIAALNDPFEVFEYAAGQPESVAVAAEQALTAAESRAAALAPPSPAAFALVRSLTAAGHRLAVVSSNAPGPISAYLTKWGIAECFDGIFGRTNVDYSLLKPNPFLLNCAMRELRTRPADSCFIGDSVSDVQAAHAAGIAVIALANRPGKAELFRPHAPDAIVASMAELAAGS